MIYILIPSLVHIALVKIATNLWIQDDIIALILKFNFKEPGDRKRWKWEDIENKVEKKVLQFSQPEHLKDKISGLIKPIGIQILKYLEYYLCIVGDIYVTDNLSKVFWTPQGTVDKKKTAETLIKDKKLDITSRYELACIFCLEDDIPRLWSLASKECEVHFYLKSNPRWINQNRLVMIWTYYINGEEEKLKCMYECMGPSYTLFRFAFESAVDSGNKAGAESFLQKINCIEVEQSLVLSMKYITEKCSITSGNSFDFPDKHYVDVLYFLLSEMNEEQRIKVYEMYHSQILECFLDFPWQGLFMEMANRMWDFLDESDYDILLQIIFKKIIDGYKDYSYRELFEEFWKRSPETHRNYVIDKCASESVLLSNLFIIKDEKIIRLILKDATLSVKKNLISCKKGQEICRDLISDHEWNFLELFIRECVQSKNEMIKFKQEYVERASKSCSKSEFSNKKGKWQKFFRLLDDFISDFDKVELIEGDTIPDKQLHGLEFEVK